MVLLFRRWVLLGPGNHCRNTKSTIQLFYQYQDFSFNEGWHLGENIGTPFCEIRSLGLDLRLTQTIDRRKSDARAPLMAYHKGTGLSAGPSVRPSVQAAAQSRAWKQNGKQTRYELIVTMHLCYRGAPVPRRSRRSLTKELVRAYVDTTHRKVASVDERLQSIAACRQRSWRWCEACNQSIRREKQNHSNCRYS